MRIVLAAVLALSLASCAPRATSAPPASGSASATPAGNSSSAPSSAGGDGDPIAAIVDRVIERAHVPGLAVSIVRDGAVVRRELRGVAELEWGQPVTADTAFTIASTTKIFTATLTLLLVEDGALRLDAPVATYLPEAPAAWKDLTVGHLAAHASGIAELEPADDATVEAVVAAAQAAPLAAPPGTAAAYGKTDLTVLQLVLERASGRSFAALLHDRIAAPLGFTCTRYEDADQQGPTRTAELVPRRATVYRWTGDRQRRAWFLYPRHAYASGGAFSCLADLERWAIALDDGRLLSPASEALAVRGFRLRDGTAGGWSVVFATSTVHGRPAYGHSGGPALADVVRIPDRGVTVIVLANQQRLYPDLAATLASIELGPPPRAAAPADPDPAATARHRALIAGFAGGQLADGDFAAAARAELVPELRAWGPLIAAPWPPLTDVAFAGEARTGEGVTRAYLATHGPAVRVRWSITTDAAGAVTAIDPRVD